MGVLKWEPTFNRQNEHDIGAKLSATSTRGACCFRIVCPWGQPAPARLTLLFNGAEVDHGSVHEIERLKAVAEGMCQ